MLAALLLGNRIGEARGGRGLRPCHHWLGGFRLRFDAMHAVTGPYAREIFEGRLGAGFETDAAVRPLSRFVQDVLEFSRPRELHLALHSIEPILDDTLELLVRSSVPVCPRWG